MVSRYYLSNHTCSKDTFARLTELSKPRKFFIVVLLLTVKVADADSSRCMMWLNWTSAKVDPNSCAIPPRVSLSNGRDIGSLYPSLENGFMTCFDVRIGPMERLNDNQIK